MKLALAPLLLILTVPAAYSWAIPHSKKVIKVEKSPVTSLLPTSEQTQMTREALNLPPESRLAALFKQGVSGYRSLRYIAFESNENMAIRWRAFMAMAILGREHSLPELEKAAQHKEWFLRSGALKALNQWLPEKGIIWARRLVNDKAMVVRNAAVNVLKSRQDLESGDLLWSKMKASENFRGDNSLWIRRNIAETLASFARQTDTARFIELLDDKDESLHAVAITALEKVTQKRLGQTIEPVAYKRTYWKNWWADNKSQGSLH